MDGAPGARPVHPVSSPEARVPSPEPPAQGPESRTSISRAAALYVALTILLTYPLSVDPARQMLPMGADGDLLIWTLGWDVHAFVHQPFAIFDANIYHPRRHTLAYSENLIGSAFLAAPVLWTTGNGVLAFNLVALASCVLCGLGTYVLARRVGVGPLGAMVAGLVFAFAPPRFFRLGQLHLTTVQWLPFGLAALHAYLDGGRPRDLRLAAGLFTLQALTSGHGAVFLGLAMLILCAYRVLLGEPLKPVRRLRDLGVTGAVLLVPAVLIFLPYRAAQTDVGLRRTLENWAIPASDFWASPTHLHAHVLALLNRSDIIERAGAFLFPGYLPILLAVAALAWRGRVEVPRREFRRATCAARVAVGLELVALASLVVAGLVSLFGDLRLRTDAGFVLSVRNPRRAWLVLGVALALRVAMARVVPIDAASRLRRWREALGRWAEAHRRSALSFYTLLALTGVWLSMGPPFSLWPHVYWLPGFNFIRVRSRFTILALLGLAVVAGIGFERLTARLTSRTRAVAASLATVLLVAEFIAIPLTVGPAQVAVPEVDRWLATQASPMVVAEFPVPSPRYLGPFERRQTAFMLHSMAHWQKTVHGYSGIRPPEHEALYASLHRFPDSESLQRLSDLGVTHLVVHTAWYAPAEWATVEARLEDFSEWVRLEHVAADGRVYSLRAQARTPPPPGSSSRSTR